MTVEEDDIKRLVDLDESIVTKLKDAHDAGVKGDVDHSQKLCIEVETLEKVKANLEVASLHNEKRSWVCDISGNFLSSTDSDDRCVPSLLPSLLPSFSPPATTTTTFHSHPPPLPPPSLPLTTLTTSPVHHIHYCHYDPLPLPSL